MKIFVDENIPVLTVQWLKLKGFDVLDIRGTLEEGLEDEEIWHKIQLEERMIITTDKGFSHYRNHQHYGILIVRLKQPNVQKIHERVIKAIDQFSEDDWKGLLVVMRDAVQSTWKK